MKTIKYNSLKELHVAINKCEQNHSDMWDSRRSFSFIVYDDDDKTPLELHIFNYR